MADFFPVPVGGIPSRCHRDGHDLSGEPCDPNDLVGSSSLVRSDDLPQRHSRNKPTTAGASSITRSRRFFASPVPFILRPPLGTLQAVAAGFTPAPLQESGIQHLRYEFRTALRAMWPFLVPLGALYWGVPIETSYSLVLPVRILRPRWFTVLLAALIVASVVNDLLKEWRAIITDCEKS